jgi:hypothetical protein
MTFFPICMISYMPFHSAPVSERTCTGLAKLASGPTLLSGLRHFVSPVGAMMN